MSSDILGPADAPNSVTDRPSDTRTFGAIDTFFRDCTNPDTEDGTDIQAAFLNGMIASLRSVWRMNGLRNDGVSPIITENGLDDAGIAKAIQQLVQRGLVVYGVDTGAANALAVTLTPALLEYKAGLRLMIKAAASNTGATTLNVNGLGARNVVRRDGAILFDSDVLAGAVQEYAFDGTNFQLLSAIGSGQLVRNLNLYVNAAIGSDANDGTANTAGKALASIQAAIDRAFSYPPSQYSITIHVAPGVYGPARTPLRAGPDLIITGDTVTPSNVTINGGDDAAFAVAGPNTVTLEGVRWTTGNPTVAVPGVNAGPGSTLITRYTESGYCQFSVFEAFYGSLQIVGNHRFTANSQYLFVGYGGGGQVQIGTSVILTIANAITVTASAYATVAGAILAPPPRATFVNPGNITGLRYRAELNGIINTVGAGTSYLPGSADGVTVSGGQYA